MKNIAKSKFVSEGWAGLPSFAKGVILVGVGIGAYILVKKIIGKTQDIKKEQGKRQEDRSWNQAFDKLNSNPSTKATMTKEQMKAVANKIENTLDGYGTRDYDLKQAFKNNIKNDADFAGLSAAFGIREIEPGYGIGWASPTFKGTLIECINDDASSSTIDEINEYLRKQKIKYRI